MQPVGLKAFLVLLIFIFYLEDMPPFDVFEGDSLVEAHKHEEVGEVDVLQHKRTHDKHCVGVPN